MRQNSPIIVHNKVKMRPTKAIRASFDQPEEGIFEYKVVVVMLGLLGTGWRCLNLQRQIWF
jgi:predicted secreted protein